MPARLVEEDAAGAPLDDDREAAAGRRAGVELGQRLLGGAAGDLLHVVLVEQLEADGVPERLVPGLQAGVAAGHHADAEQGAHLLVVGQDPVGVGHEDALAAVAVPGGHLHHGGTGVAGGLVGPQEELDLGRLADGVGRDRHVADAVRRLPGERHDPRSSPALAGRRRGRFRRRQEAGLAEVGRVRVAGRLALDDPDACAPVAPGGHLLDLAVVQVGRRRALVLHVHLGELGSGAQARGEHTLYDVLVDHLVSHAAEPTDEAAGDPGRATTVTSGAQIAPNDRCTVTDAICAEIVTAGGQGRRANQRSEPRAARARRTMAPATNQPLMSFWTGSSVSVRPRSS